MPIFELILNASSLIAVLLLMSTGLFLAWKHSVSISRRIGEERSGRYGWGTTTHPLI